MAKDVDKAKRKMARRIRDSVTDFEEGVKDVKEDPVKKALENLEKMINRLMEAIKSGKLEAGLREAVKKGKWFKSIDKMIRHWSEIADEIADNWAEVYDEWLKSCVDECQKKVEGMREDTLEDRIRKSAEYQRCMNECAKRKKGYGKK